MKTLSMNALWIIFAASSLIVTPSFVNAAPCKNVDILLNNNSDKHLKTLFANFKCEGENEKKEMFNNVEVPEMTKLPIATQQNLQGCKGKKMEYIEVHYKVRCAKGGWSKEKFIKDSSFANAFCSSDTGKQFTVVLPADDPQVAVGC